jgi:hypothetical protein
MTDDSQKQSRQAAADACPTEDRGAAMTEPSQANLQLAIMLPLGVVANQLLRIEADLRFLNMKTFACAKQSGDFAMGPQITARLDQINQALDLIRGLTSDIAADMYPKPARGRHDSSQRED